MRRRLLGLTVVALATLAAVPASAHHSFAMFDRKQELTIVGTVKALELINPHSWLSVLAPDKNGRIVNWSLEMGSPGQQARIGWTAQSLKPGDKVTVKLYRLRDGSSGGQLVSVLTPDGKILEMGLPIPKGPSQPPKVQ